MSALSERINAANSIKQWNSRRIETEAKKEGFTLSNGTAFKILKGTHGNVTDDSLRALARIYDLDLDELRGLVGLPAENEPWEPPVASSRLTNVQRELIESLIHQLVRPLESAGTGHGNSLDEKRLTLVEGAGIEGPTPTMADDEVAQTEAGPSVGQMQRDAQNKDAESE